MSRNWPKWSALLLLISLSLSFYLYLPALCVRVRVFLHQLVAWQSVLYRKDALCWHVPCAALNAFFCFCFCNHFLSTHIACLSFWNRANRNVLRRFFPSQPCEFETRYDVRARCVRLHALWSVLIMSLWSCSRRHCGSSAVSCVCVQAFCPVAFPCNVRGACKITLPFASVSLFFVVLSLRSRSYRSKAQEAHSKFAVHEGDPMTLLNGRVFNCVCPIRPFF